MSVQTEIKPVISTQTQHKSFYGALLADCQPREIWDFFEAISQIPRASGNEQAVGDFVVSIAKAKNLEAFRDNVGNVIVRKPASSEQYAHRPMITLQSHLDMVCEKNKGVEHDFTKDPIKLMRDGKYLKAAGTTLGADNGMGVSTMLAIIASDSLIHGPLEFLFTTDEEAGFGGAKNLKPETLKGRILLNLDSEEIDSFYVGCAGGCEVFGKLSVTFEALKGDFHSFQLSITGLRGGHSGVDINSGRANSLKVLGQCLSLLAKHGGKVVALDGGNKRNAIPRYAEATIAVPEANEENFKVALADLTLQISEHYKAVDPNISIVLTTLAIQEKALDTKSQQAITDLLNNVPHGMISMSPDIAELVETSTNLARVFTTANAVIIETKQRSLLETGKHDIANVVIQAMKAYGAEAAMTGSYPGWKPELSSPILKVAKKTYERLYGKIPGVKAIHAGLECGQIGECIPGMDMIAFGPNVFDAHSPDERVEIESVPFFWNFITTFLADFAEQK